ncbi:hypothetical protein BsWGS_21174 [Bradybaena similaris]
MVENGPLSVFQNNHQERISKDLSSCLAASIQFCCLLVVALIGTIEAVSPSNLSLLQLSFHQQGEHTRIIVSRGSLRC